MCKIADVIVGVLLLIISVFDYKQKKIPVLLLIGTSVAVLFLLIFVKRTLPGASIGGGALGVVFFLISRFTNEAVGYGDSWIILLLGVYLGRFEALQVLLLAALGAAVGSLYCLWRNRWNRNVTIPFVPFITAAYMGVLFL